MILCLFRLLINEVVKNVLFDFWILVIIICFFLFKIFLVWLKDYVGFLVFFDVLVFFIRLVCFSLILLFCVGFWWFKY